MKNDEKKIPAQSEESVESKTPFAEETPAKDAEAPRKEKGSFGSWWKNLGIALKALIIAGAALVVIVPILLVILLPGGNGGTNGNNNVNGNNNNGGGNGGNSDNGPKDTYSVTVVTEGGMPMAKLPVYVYKYENGTLGEFVDYFSTDDNGKAVLELPRNGSYAVSIESSIPDGYEVAAHYPLVSADLDIKVSSAVLEESMPSGYSYKLGDVMYDFAVTTTEGKQFKLSDVLKEKKAVLINFWYTDCSWCITEFPLMQAAYDKYKDDLAIIALDPIDEELVDIRSFKDRYGLTFDVAQDPLGLSSAFNVEGYPTSVMIDRYGVVTMVEAGAITSQRVFDVVFEHFTALDYDQQIIVDYNAIVPKEKPDVFMPSSDEISSAFDKGTIDGIEYLPYPPSSKEEEIEYSWPFITGDFKGETVIKPSNAFKEGSFAQMIINVYLEAGEALAFDYFSSTERGSDILYVIVDGKDIYSISGPYDPSMTKEERDYAEANNDWASCYAYVAEESGYYQVALVYQKDNSDDYGDDTVYLKNLRKCTVADIDSPTYIYRFAAKNPDGYSNYQDYAEVFYNENDGYYHVGSVNGPLLLATLMSYTRFKTDDYVYNMALGRPYEADIVKYCNYASNSQINGVCPVTKELKELLWKIVVDYGNVNNENDWLKLCCYYDSYGTDEELSDPIKGLAFFSAYETVLSNKGDAGYPNSITYDRVIMPRGLFSKFTPAESGVYYIASTAPGTVAGTFIDCDAWIFTEGESGKSEIWYTYANSDRNNIGEDKDMSNVYMIAYLEAGRDYYINIAYGDVYQEGTIRFRIERLGDAGIYRFSLASPGFFTALVNDNGEFTGTVSGGIPVEFKDGYWREKRDDGREGSILYADFTRPTGIFSQSISKLIEIGGFNLATTESDEYVKALMKSNNAYAYYLKLYLKDLWGAEYNANYAEYKVDDVLNGVYHGEKDADNKPTKTDKDEYIIGLLEQVGENTEYNNNENFIEFLKYYWGDSYQDNMTAYQVEDVLDGIYHGSGEDYTAAISEYLDKVITVGYNAELGETINEGDERIGCVMVDARLAELLQIIMDKYTFKDIEHSFAKLCYYHQYFGPTSPN